MSSTQVYLMQENPKSLEDAVKLANQRESQTGSQTASCTEVKPQTFVEETRCNQSSITSTKNDLRTVEANTKALC